MARAQGRKLEFRPINLAGINSKVWQAEGSATDIKGALFTLRGEIAKSYGIHRLPTPNSGGDPLVGLGQFHWNGRTDILVEYNGAIYIVEGNSYTALVSDRYNAQRPRDATRFVQVNDVLLLLNGRDGNLKWDGHKLTPLGIVAPPAPPGATIVGTGEGGSNNWRSLAIIEGSDYSFKYKLTWLNDKGQESEPSSASDSVDDDDVTSGDGYNVFVFSLAQVPGQDDLISRLLYRSTDGGQTYKLITEIPGLQSDTFHDWHKPGEESTDLLSDVGTNTPPPLCKWAFPYRGRTYYGGSPSSQSTLFYSRENGGKEAVPLVNLLDVSSHDGDILTGGVAAADYALVFKRRSVWELTHDKNDNPVGPTLISNSIGCVSDRAVATFESRTYWLGENGLYAYDGSHVRPISIELDRWIKQLPQAYLEDAVAWVDAEERRVMLSVVSEGSTNNEVWAIHVDTGAFTRLTDFNVYSAVSYKHETIVGCRHTHSGSARDVLGQWASSYKLVDDDFDGRFETEWLELGDPNSDKTFYRLDVWYVQTGDITMTVDWAADWDDRTNSSSTTFNLADPDATIWDEGNWDSSTREWDGPRVRSKRLDLNALNAKSIRFGFETARGDTPWKLVGFLLHFAEHGVRNEGLDLE